METKIYLETRGTARSAGYRFLGDEPAQAWWRHYRAFTAFEYPTILVESDTAGWRVFLSGIPSSRVDAVGTTNRFTIVIESAPGSEDAELVVLLVSTWLGDITKQRSEVGLQHALDAVFTDEVVTRLYKQQDHKARGEVARNVRQALQELKMPVEPTESDDPMRSWIAPIRVEKGLAGFVDRVRKLLDGKQGVAILVNLTSDPRAFDALRPQQGGLFVLAVDENRDLPDKLGELPEAESPKKEGRPTARRPQAQRRSSRWIPKIRYVALAALVVVVVGVTVWLIVRSVLK